jgi:hypothetical protein
MNFIQVYRLLVDGGIRWNSTEAMISRCMFPFIVFILLADVAIILITLEILALKLRAAIELYRLRWKLPSQKYAYGLRQDFLTEDDWADLTR